MFPPVMTMDAPTQTSPDDLSGETGTDDLSSETGGSRLLTRLGVGSSILIHIAVLGWIVFGTGVRLYNPSPAEAIAVELVTPQEAEPRAKPEEAKQKKKNDTLTDLDLSIPKPTMPDDQANKNLSLPASATSAAAKQSAPAKQQQAPAAPSQPAAAQPPPPPPQQTMTFAANAPAVAQPDLGEKYSTMLGLSDAGFSPDTLAAKIDTGTVNIFRAHLRKCLQMPPSVTTDDKVRIVLRVALSPEGNLMASPALIEASASPKGPLLMQGAIKALQACQPYDMLPVDKYKEWRVLDLRFTPRDFGSG